MEIKIWGDFACPFCYIGETQLEKVINESGKKEDMKIRFMAYQLDPDAPVIPVESMTQHFMDGHDQTEEEAKKQMERITKMAARVGLEYNLADAQVCNTFDAHRLMKYAQDSATSEIVEKLNFKLFHANFVENLRLSDRGVLLAIAEMCGLDRNSVEAVLESEMYGDQVKAEAKELDEKADFEFVPYMVFDDATVLQGVISVGAMKKAL
ncbi:MAG: DsbA family oxidoreductase [Muribaculaceae bacterium]|nr:DsbA family oxidoreductase [Muribaculaceae bacterium]